MQPRALPIDAAVCRDVDALDLAVAGPCQSPDFVLSRAVKRLFGAGNVMTDLASINQVNPREVPSGIRSVYFEVSSRVYHGLSPSLIRRSHLMLTLPSQPGTTSRSG